MDKKAVLNQAQLARKDPTIPGTASMLVKPMKKMQESKERLKMTTK